jgi:hypothetical protein
MRLFPTASLDPMLAGILHCIDFCSALASDHFLFANNPSKGVSRCRSR